MATHGTLTSTNERALALLGSGIGPEVVASAIGVSVSAISQLLSDPEFSAKVAQLRFESLSKHNIRDNAYDDLEDTLIERLRDCLPLMHRPMEILKAISVINAAKRRGASAPEQLTQQATVVQLVMPTQIINKFTANINNQVIKVGDKDLLTIQSGTLLEQAKAKIKERIQDGQFPQNSLAYQASLSGC